MVYVELGVNFKIEGERGEEKKLQTKTTFRNQLSHLTETYLLRPTAQSLKRIQIGNTLLY